MSRSKGRGNWRYILWARVASAWAVIDVFNSAAEADTHKQEMEK
jgi:hypothetical protein